MKTNLIGLFLAACVLSVRGVPTIPDFVSTYTQDFNTPAGLASSGTSSTVPDGWAFSESGSNADTTYAAGTGSSNAGDTYSFGASGNAERAFGGLQSGTLIPIIGVQFMSAASAPIINGLVINYIGEQWRLGTADRGADRLDFQYSLDATSLTTGTWIDVDALDFSSPITTGTVGLRDGNAAANRTGISATIPGLNIAPGSTFWLRWTDFNASGADDGLAIDDFSIRAVPETLPFSFGAAILLGCLVVCRRFAA